MRRLSFQAGLGVLLALAGFAASAAPAGASLPPETFWVKLSPVTMGPCARVAGDGDWAGLDLGSCSGSPSQFRTGDAGWGYYGHMEYIRNAASGKCLDAYPGPWGQVIQYTCDGGWEQKWYLEVGPHGFIAESAIHIGWCAVGYDNKVILAPCNGDAGQAWEWWYA